MLERVFERGRRLAERRAAAKALELEGRLRAELPDDVVVEEGTGGIILSGRGLRRRFALEPALRWLTAALK